jgi:purine-binding chemotaxis protein CheW
MESSSTAAHVAEPPDVVDTARQYVTFLTGDDAYAVELAPVQEIIRVPSVVPVPLAPAALEGLANLRGRVLPLLNLRRAIGLPARERDESTRALVVDTGQPIGVVVDRVSSVVSVAPDALEPVDDSMTSALGDLVQGVLKQVGGHEVLMVLDVQRLLDRELALVGNRASRTRRVTPTEVASSTGATERDGTVDEAQPYVSFTVNAQEYALDVRQVREILRVPERIAHVPNAAPHLLGVTTVRERLLPLVCLRRVLGVPAGTLDERSRVVVIGDADRSIGLVTDAVHEVLRVTPQQLDAVPAHVHGASHHGHVHAICRLDDGRRLVSVLDAQQLIPAGLDLTTSTTMADQHTLSTDTFDDTLAEDEQVVVLRLGAQEFGVPIDAVQEIVRVPETLTDVPHAPAFVEGVMNLRGTVLPVLDLRKRLGMEAIERNDSQRVLVFIVDGTRTGFIVDAVSEVLRIPRRAITEAPALSTAQRAVLGRVANLETTGRIVQLLAPAPLLASTGTGHAPALAA